MPTVYGVTSGVLLFEVVNVLQPFCVRDDELVAWSRVKPADGGMGGYDELIFM
jgi:hypothetical protein